MKKKVCVILMGIALSIGVTACGLFGMEVMDGPQEEVMEELEAGEGISGDADKSLSEAASENEKETEKGSGAEAVLTEDAENDAELPDRKQAWQEVVDVKREDETVEAESAEIETASEEVTDELSYETYENGVLFKTKQHPIKEYNEKDYLLMEGQYEEPQILIDANPEATEQIQAHLDEVMEVFYTDQEDNLIILSEQLQTMQDTGMHGSRYMNFSLEEASDYLISMTVYDEVFLGGAHGSHTTKGMTFARTTGEYLTLKRLFKDWSVAKEEITAQILEQMEQKKEEAGVDFFFPDYEKNIAALLEVDEQALNANWYIKDGNLIIIANEYELAAYAAGAFEFVIPMKSLSMAWEEYQ